MKLLPVRIRSFTLAAGILAASLLAFAQAPLYQFTTIAGDPGYGSADGTNSSVRFWKPIGVVAESDGTVYVADTENHTIRRVMLVGTNWLSSTIAGLAGVADSADGTNNAARFNLPYGVAVDGSGNLYVADWGNDSIRQLVRSGTNWVSSTIAGLPGSAGSKDGTNSSSRFSRPSGITVDSEGTVFVTDSTNNTVRALTRIGTDWVSHTIAGKAGSAGAVDGTNTTTRFNSPQGIAADVAGSLYIADTGNRIIRKLTPSGTNWISSTIAGKAKTLGGSDGTNSAIRFFTPTGVAVDSETNVYVVDIAETVRKLRPVDTNWVSSTVAGKTGYIGTTDATNAAIRFFQPCGIAAADNGALYIADTWNNTVRQLLPSGTNWVSSTIGGAPHLWGAGEMVGTDSSYTNIFYFYGSGATDGTNSNCRFHFPFGIALGPQGDLIVVDSNNDAIRRLSLYDTNWVSATLAGSPGITGSADGTNADVRFNVPYGAAVDRAGNIFVADSYNHTVRKLTLVGTNWVSSTIAGRAGVPGGADGTNSNARFTYPGGIVLDDADNVFVTDQYAVRKLTLVGADWVSTTLAGRFGGYGSPDGTNAAARFYQLWGIALDGTGNLYVADSGNNTIRKITPVGTNWVVSTIAGRAQAPGAVDGTNSAARFYAPAGVAVDGEGNVYVAENENNLIRKLTPVGTNWVVTTIGSLAGAIGYADGIGSAARFNAPSGIVVDRSGTLYVMDTVNDSVRQGVPLIVTPRCKDVIVSADVNCLAQASIEDGSFNPAGGAFTLRQFPPGPYPLGTNLVTLSISDDFGTSNSCTAPVIVVDTTPPELVCPSDSTIEFTSPAGAEVLFEPQAIDFCSAPVIVSSSAPRGSTLPVGTTAVRYSAADAAGNSTSCTFNLTVLGAQGVISNVLAESNALRGNLAPLPAQDSLVRAIHHLLASLAPTIWIDQTHLSVPHGEIAFNQDKEAVQALWLLSRSKSANIPAKIVQNFIDRILRADRLIAFVALQDASAAGANQSRLSDAQRELALGDEEALNGKYEPAIGHYRNAWHQAARLLVKLAVHRDTDNSLHIELSGLPGEAYALEVSTNLIDWVQVETIAAGPDGLARSVVGPAKNSRSAFYRTRAVP